MSASQIQALFAGLFVISGLLTFFISRRHTETIEDSDASGRSITAIADAAETLVGPLTDELKRVAAACARHERRLELLEAHIDILQRQIIDLGADPHPSPPDDELLL